MKTAVFGAGGVGALVGGALARVNDDTYLICRGEKLRTIRERGLEIDSAKLGNFTVKPKLATADPGEIGVADLVIMSCKGYDLKECCAAARPLIGEHTVVIPLLNGVIVSDIMEEYLPRCVLADGCIYVFSSHQPPGRVTQPPGPCRITFGMKDGSRPPVLDEIAALLTGAGIPSEVSGDILLDSWSKYTFMCGNTVILAHYDEAAGGVVKNAGHEKVLRDIWGELVSVAAARGVTLAGDVVDRYVEAFLKMPPDGVTSLYRDLRDGKSADQTELYHVVGRLVELGEAAGVPTPYHRAVYEKYSHLN